MPPKVKVTKNDIINAAVETVRLQGAQALGARAVAAALGSSTQPVFSNFSTMEELKQAVTEAARSIYQRYAAEETGRGNYPVYKSHGMAYIRFAKEEKELFKFLFMRDNGSTLLPAGAGVDPAMEQLVQSNTGLSEKETKLFHLEMWAFVHGIATMFATGFLDLEEELVSRMLTDAYLGLRKHYETEQNDGSH